MCTLLVFCLPFVLMPAHAEETDVAALQKRLLFMGYEIGEADGIMGPKTRSAILLAQTLLTDQRSDINPAGLTDAETVKQIMDEKNTELLRTLLRGSWGSRVREAQTKLIGLNLLWDSADGAYGANTEAAVIAFEEQMEKLLPGRIRRDGRLSSDEYALLMSDLSVYGFEAPVCFDDGHPENLK